MAHQRSIVSIGNYRFTGVKLGKGAFAVVKLAKHILTDTHAAVKVIHLSRIDDSYVQRHYTREAEILGSLRHPNIVRLIEICTTNRLFCLALEYMEGSKTLQDYIEKNGSMSENLARLTARQLIAAIGYLHSKNILHRDLKLDNILIEECNWRCLLIDFGLSNTWYAGKTMKTHCGSAEYAAPELFKRDKHYGPEIDMWSFGIVLYVVTLGKLPFQLNPSEASKMNVFIQTVLNGLGNDHRTALNSKLSSECCSMIVKCLHLNPKVRLTVLQAACDPWILADGLGPVSFAETESSENFQLMVASDLREKMKLDHSAVEILNYVKARPFQTTGGVFNLLSIQRLKNQATLDGNPVSSPKEEQGASSEIQHRDHLPNRENEFREDTPIPFKSTRRRPRILPLGSVN